jgi:hypothetical protein
MTRKQLQKIARRFTVAVVIAALAVPTVASAHPAGNTGSSGGPNHGSATQIYVPTDPGQLRVTEQLSLPSSVVLRKSGPVDQGPKLAPVRITSVQQTSTFDWTDALIGAGVTAAIMALALGGALVARRQGRLGYR